MNVLFFTLSVSRNAGGIFFSVRSLAQNLEKIGVNCRALAPHDKFTTEDLKKWSPVPVDTYNVQGPSSLGYSSSIKELIGVPDIQHIHGIWMYHSRVNRQLALKNGVPYVISPHGMLDKWAVGNSRWKKKLVGWLYENSHLRDASCIHALCESEAASIRKFGLKNPICVIPNAVDLPVLSAVCKKPKTNSSEKRLLFLGRLHPKKGIEELFQAFASLESAYRDRWRLVIAGWGDDYQPDLVSQARSLNIEDKVDFVGPKFGEAKADLFRECDAFTLPSFSEGLPMAVLEAWSYAMPSLITNACNLPEGQRASATITCHSGAEGVKSGLLELFSLSESAQTEMGSRARMLVEEKFTWPIVSMEMKKVYQWLLRKSDRPNCVRMYN